MLCSAHSFRFLLGCVLSMNSVFPDYNTWSQVCLCHAPGYYSQSLKCWLRQFTCPICNFTVCLCLIVKKTVEVILVLLFIFSNSFVSLLLIYWEKVCYYFWYLGKMYIWLCEVLFYAQRFLVYPFVVHFLLIFSFFVGIRSCENSFL